jgi:uncharacterized protein DUF4838
MKMSNIEGKNFQGKQLFETKLLLNWLTIMLLFFASVLSAGEKLNIPGDKIVIVLPETEKSQKGSQQAAKDLKLHLELITGAPVKQLSSLPKGDYGFFVGVPAPGDETAQFSCDEGKWKITKKGVYFYGNKNNTGNAGSGALFAVCDFLESQLGVRWIQPGDIAFKKQNPLNLETGKGGWKSVLIERFIWPGKIRKPGNKEAKEFGWPEAERKNQRTNTVDWMYRMRVCKFINWDTRHAFGKWWEKYGKDHPEYFALNKENYRGPIKGTRKDIQLCVSNPKVAEQIMTNFLNRKPRAKNVNISNNDSTETWCHCAECRKLDVVESKEQIPGDPLPDQTDRYINFANRVAKLARKVDPNLKVHTIAYLETTFAPKREKVDPNILLTYVPIPINYQLDSVQNILNGWIKAGAKTVRFRPNLQHYMFAGALPLGCEKFMYDMIHAMTKYPEINAFNFDGFQHFWAVSGFANYVLAKSISNTGKSFKYWENHYLDAFGPAREDMRQYFRCWRKIWDKKLYPDYTKIVKRGRKNQLSYFCSGVAMAPEKYYSMADFAKADGFLKRALKHKLTPEERARIENFKLANDHASLLFDALVAQKIAKKNKSAANLKASKAKTKALMQFRREHKNWRGIPLARIIDNEINWNNLIGLRVEKAIIPRKSDDKKVTDSFPRKEWMGKWKAKNAKGKFLHNKSDGHNGKGCMEIITEKGNPKKSNFCFSKAFPVWPGKTYTAIVWVKVLKANTDAGFSIAFQGLNNKRRFLGTPAHSIKLEDANTSKEWRQLVLTFTVPKTGKWLKANYLLCTLAMGNTAEGRVLFDDFSFFKEK